MYSQSMIGVKQNIMGVIGLVQLTNQYLNASEFWKQKNKQDQYQIIGTASQALRVISILMYPIIPQYAQTLLRYFKVNEAERRLENCKITAEKEVVVKYDPEVRGELFIRKLKHS